MFLEFSFLRVKFLFLLFFFYKCRWGIAFHFIIRRTALSRHNADTRNAFFLLSTLPKTINIGIVIEKKTKRKRKKQDGEVNGNASRCCCCCCCYAYFLYHLYTRLGGIWNGNGSVLLQRLLRRARARTRTRTRSSQRHVVFRIHARTVLQQVATRILSVVS